MAGLHEAVRSQESQWAAAERQLQSRRDALAQQNLELRAGLKTSGPPWPGAGEAVTGTLGPRRKSDPLVSDGILAVPRGSITVKVDTQSPVPVVTFSLQEVRGLAVCSPAAPPSVAANKHRSPSTGLLPTDG